MTHTGCLSGGSGCHRVGAEGESHRGGRAGGRPCVGLANFEKRRPSEHYIYIVCEKKNSTRGRKRPHRFFIKRKPHRLTRVEKPPRTLTHAQEGQASRRAQRGVFFTPTAGNSLLMRIELRTCWGATLPDWASQLAARPFVPGTQDDLITIQMSQR